MNNTNHQPTLEEALQREQQRAAELAYLYQIALDLMSLTGAPLDETSSVVLGGMLELLTCRSASLLLWRPQFGLVPSNTRNAADGDAPEWPTPEFCEQVFAQRRAIVRNSGASGSDIGVKLLAKDEPLGILTAHREAGTEPFGDNEIQLITLLASVTAAVIINVRLQQNLNDRLNMVQTVMEASPSGLAVIEGGRLLLANPAALHALRLGYDAFDTPLNVDGPDGLLMERLHEALPPSPITSFEYRVSGRRGQTRYLRIDVVPVGPDKILAQINDITLLRDMESRREEAVANTSHELKTPLAVMNLGLSNLLSYYERMPDEDRRSMIEETLEQVSEMKNLISGLLDQSRKTKRATQPISEPVIMTDAAFYIEQVCLELMAFARYHEINLQWVTPANSLPTIFCPVQDLRTVVRNLLTNAIKYTHPGGRVLVDTAVLDDGNTLAVRVADTGVGIPESELEIIFEHSYRASTRGAAEGTGLGLSFVRDIITKIGGSVTVESQVNVGSTFTILLPCVTAMQSG